LNYRPCLLFFNQHFYAFASHKPIYLKIPIK